ncbi:MAG: hypothetical protein A2161_08255 [Candidatus Schekmanbacteria bacterium RBG_13_48_7]|uniref:GIY-YIG domain-containing protein n=1 Tax=Candidatus Schekmanbacteria bacterium RBG_13_48_7 TaxID=1817878 RepID=A0A1F7RQ25_9BACT|nr:MAG: hypothetical protein A2161_08255 [Candidatus Schekmanbacteria bacterium RBG_13_48_7]
MCKLFYLGFGMAYDIDFKERGYIREHIEEFLLFPDFWNDPNHQLNVVLNWHHIKFDSANLNAIPNNQKGIYCFVVKPVFSTLFETRYLFYIGETIRDFRTRYSEYLDDAAGKGKPRSRVFKMFKLWKDYLHFYYANITANSDIHDSEEKLLNTFVPRVNTLIPEAKIKPELKNIYL